MKTPETRPDNATLFIRQEGQGQAMTIKDSLDASLAGLSMTQDMKHSVRMRIKKDRQPAHLVKPWLRYAIIALILLSTLTAFALTRGFGLLQMVSDHLDPAVATVRPEAYEMLQTDLGFYRFDHVDVAIKEAVYDGKYLRLAYTVKDRSVKEPFAKEPTLTYMIPGFQMKAAEADGISWETLDWCEIDGQHYNPLGSSAAYSTENPGEIMTWVQFDVTGATLPPTFRVSTPIRGQDTPEELVFTMSSALKGVQQLALQKPQRVGDYQISVTEFMLSPIRVYVTAELVVDPGVDIRQCETIMNQWMMKAKLGDHDWQTTFPLAEMAGAGYTDNVVFEQLPLPDGQVDMRDRVIDPKKPVTIRVRLEFVPQEEYPDSFRLGVSITESLLIKNQPMN